MFTGIINETVKIIAVDEQRNFRTHIIKLSNNIIDNLEKGASIAHNGCCLTVANINGNHISFDLIKETLQITNLGVLQPGDMVNIERAVKYNDEIGGHLMSGHIMTTAEVIKISNLRNNYEIWFQPKNLFLMKYIFYKGFIGVDGVSLTVGKITETQFCVHLIPETLKRTTLGMKQLGQSANLEIDYQTQAIVDTVERFLSTKKNVN